MIRKLMLTGVLIFFLPGTISQIAFGMMVAGFFLCVHLYMQAFIEDDDDFMQLCAMICASLTLFCGIILAAQKVEENKQGTTIGKGVMSIVLVVLQVGIVCLSLWCALFKKILPQISIVRARVKKLKAVMAERNAGSL